MRRRGIHGDRRNLRILCHSLLLLLHLMLSVHNLYSCRICVQNIHDLSCSFSCQFSYIYLRGVHIFIVHRIKVDEIYNVRTTHSQDNNGKVSQSVSQSVCTRPSCSRLPQFADTASKRKSLATPTGG